MHLCDIENGQSLSGCFLLRQASLRSTAAGKPYLSGQLADKTAAVELKVWDYSGPITPANTGSAVKVRGTVNEYRGARQLAGRSGSGEGGLYFGAGLGVSGQPAGDGRPDPSGRAGGSL